MYTVDFISNSDANYLITKLKYIFNVDYSRFSRPVFQRKVYDFMISHNILEIESLVEIIEKDNIIFQSFVNEISIKEIEMFRDTEFWQALEKNIFVKLLSLKNKIKIWFPDSMGGAEYYTTAIILKEKGYIDNVDILVSSYNEIILKTIINGVYDSKQLTQDNSNFSRFKNYNVDLSRYLISISGVDSFDKCLHKNTHFSKIDISIDSLPEDIDLIIFRNKMLLFDNQLKEKMQVLLFNSLSLNGFLAIGIKEKIDTNNSDLKLYNATEQIYIKQN